MHTLTRSLMRPWTFVSLAVTAFGLTSCSLFLPPTATPEISPPAGVYPPSVVIARIVCATPDAVIHYTLDGSRPSEKSPIYPSGGLAVDVNTLLRAMAVAPSTRRSANVEVSYTIEDRGNTVTGTIFGDADMTVPVGAMGDYDFRLLGLDRIDEDRNRYYDLDQNAYLFFCDVPTGHYTVTGIPADVGLSISGYLKQTTTAVGPHPGDLVKPEWFDVWRPSDLAAGNRRDMNTRVFQIIHLTSPFDNDACTLAGRPEYFADLPAGRSPMTVRWEPLAGAAAYRYYVDEFEGGADTLWTFVRQAVALTETTSTEVTLALAPAQNATGFYGFNLYAFDSEDRIVGTMACADFDGWCQTGFAFRISP